MKFARWRLLECGLWLTLIAYWIASEVIYAMSKRPDGVSTLSDFYVTFSDPTLVQRGERGGEAFYFLQGRMPHWPWILAFPSSAPIYVFDSSGRLIEWCSDPGDAPSFEQRWPFRQRHQIDPAKLPIPSQTGG